MSEQDANQAPDPDDALVAALQSEAEPEDNSDEAEVELGSEKIKVPKKVKEFVDGIHAKTQTEREAIRADKEATAKERAAVAENARLVSAFHEERSEMQSIDKQLEPYLKFTREDWARFGAEDPEKTRQVQIDINALQLRRQQLGQSMQAKYDDMTTKERAAASERQANAERELAAKIKDWSPAKKAAVAKEAEGYGFQGTELEPFLSDYRVVQALEDAAKYRALVKRASVPKTPTPEEEPPPETTTIRTKANTGGTPKLSDRMSPEAWQAEFLKQRRSRQSRN